MRVSLVARVLVEFAHHSCGLFWLSTEFMAEDVLEELSALGHVHCVTLEFLLLLSPLERALLYSVHHVFLVARA